MDYKSEYKSKLRTAEEAVRVVKSGDWVEYGCGVTFPTLCDAALAASLFHFGELTLEEVKGYLRGRGIPMR